MKYKKFKFSCQISTLHSKHVFHVTRVSRETVSIRDNYTSTKQCINNASQRSGERLWLVISAGVADA